MFQSESVGRVVGSICFRSGSRSLEEAVNLEGSCLSQFQGEELLSRRGNSSLRFCGKNCSDLLVSEGVGGIFQIGGSSELRSENRYAGYGRLRVRLT
jgi:hypothetical protein